MLFAVYCRDLSPIFLSDKICKLSELSCNRCFPCIQPVLIWQKLRPSITKIFKVNCSCELVLIFQRACFYIVTPFDVRTTRVLGNRVFLEKLN